MATGFPFGSAKPSGIGTGFALGTGTTPTLGAAPQPQPGSITYGTPVGQASVAPQFGQTPNFNFPSTTSAAAPAFNFNSPSSTPGLNFKPTGTTGLPGFGAATQTAAAPAGLTFGTPASSAPVVSGLNFNFGTGTSASATPGTGFNFASSTAGNTGLALSSSTPAATTVTGTSLFGNLAAKPATTTTTFPLNFGGPTTTPSLNFGTSVTGTSATQPTLNFGLGSSTAASSAGGLSFGLAAPKPTATSAAPIGLGGIATTQAYKIGVPTTTTQSETPPKETALPNEVLQTVEQFKTYVKDQKTICSDIARYSSKDFENVHLEITSMLNILTEVENELQKNRQLAEKLKYDTAKGLQNAEMAQRTHDTPPGLQYDNVAPLNYFIDLVNGFEKIFQALKTQIDITEQHVRSRGHAIVLTPQELSIGMRRLHETFVALAGRLQSVHSQVESMKKEYLNLRKHLLGDSTNVFVSSTKEALALEVAVKSILTPPKIAPGPTPFSSFGGPFVSNSASQNYSGSGSSGIGLPGSMQNSAIARDVNDMKSKPAQGGFLFSTPENSSFQLQKPPTGNKRGKH